MALVILCPSSAVSLDEVVWREVYLGEVVGDFVLRAGDPSLGKWLLPPPPQASGGHSDADIDAVVSLGRALFFDLSLIHI